MTKAGERMLKAAREARAFLNGEDVPGLIVHIPDAIDTKRIRAKLRMSQTAFAERFGFDVATLRNWEQGRRCPDGAARTLIMLIDRIPGPVQKALAEIEAA